MYLSIREWLDTVKMEYLQEFIRCGGAAIKFIVPTEEIARKDLQNELRGLSEQEGYQFASVDGATTKVHMIDHIFHDVAKQVDWEELAFLVIYKMISDNGYQVPTQRQDFNLREIAVLNGRDPHILRNELNRLMENTIFHDYQMCQEFRIAMMRLCQSQLDPGGTSPIPNEVIKEWLRGELRRISELKSALIFQKVARHNARHMLCSLSHWLHLAGKGGLVISMDISRCLMQRPRRTDLQGGGLYYTKGTTLDTYEVLRQFVDSTDEMEFTFIAIIATKAFLDFYDNRGVDSYQALKLRIWDEVRDIRRANPLSSLIRLSPCPERASYEPRVDL